MKHKESFKYLAMSLLVGGMLTQTGCSSDYLDTASTEDVSASMVYTSLDNLYMALNGIHRKMVSQDTEIQGLGGEPGFIIAREALADDMTWYGTTTWHQNFLNWSVNMNNSSSYNEAHWEIYYRYILNANMILEALEENFSGGDLSDSDQAYANHIKGECLAIRAWSHFQLVQYYAKSYQNGSTNSQAGVPYRTSSETTEMARNTVEEVYTYINNDLDEAIELLADYEPNDINHYSEPVVYGLKARVLLTQQRYSEAAEAAAQSIELAEAEGFHIMTQSELTCGFADITSDSDDAMYAAMTLDDQTVYFYSFYAYMSWNFNSAAIRNGVKCISQSTYDLMSETDLRRAWWDPTGEAEVPSSTYNTAVYQNRKFTARSTANAVGDYAFMRLTEIYLIAAEAYARAGQDMRARAYLQALLDERDPGYTTTKTGDDLIEEIMTNRRIELWGEGFRWFDLKRLGLPISRTGSNFNVSYCGFLEKSVNDDGWIFEIPKSETDYNTLMEKNY